MSLLMDALKKADEIQKDTAIPLDKTYDISAINGDSDPLSLEIIDGDMPTTSSLNSESSPIEWHDELLEDFKEIDSTAPLFEVEQTDNFPDKEELLEDFKEIDSTTPLFEVEQTDNFPDKELEVEREKFRGTTDNWDEEILPQFQADNEENTNPIKFAEEAPWNDSVNTNSGEDIRLRDDDFKDDTLEPTQATIDSQTSDISPPNEEQPIEFKTEGTAQRIDEKHNSFETVNTPHSKEAQRVLAASTQSGSSNSTFFLLGILVVLLVGMGAGYYYIQSTFSGSSILIQPGSRGMASARDARSAEETTSRQASKTQSPMSPVKANEQPAQNSPYSTLETLSKMFQETSTIAKSTQEVQQVQQKTPIEEAEVRQYPMGSEELASGQDKHTVSPMLVQQPPHNEMPLREELSTPQKTSGIKILHKTVTSRMKTELSKGYSAFQQGDDRAAQRAYTRALRKEPNNRDALLGIAAVNLRMGNTQTAQQRYRQVLQLYPQEPYAQVGLINTLDHFSPETESQLKVLLEQAPQSAYLHFSLGNIYASQRRWAHAQQAYFDALRYDKKQANYAYNLAISLDHLNQPRVALTYYQRALKLAAQNHKVSFNAQTVQKRVRTLKAHIR
jgi:tetratricopeptide (TPR) repeat protein